MPKLNFHRTAPSKILGDNGLPNRFDGWMPDFPDTHFPLKISITVPGDRSGLTTQGKLQLDARELELCFVLTSIDRDPEGVPTVAHYHLSTAERALEPYRELLD